MLIWAGKELFPRSAPVDKAAGGGFLSLMISLTDRAVEQVRQIAREKASEGQLLRIFVEAGGCSGFEYGMSFDDPKDDDKRLESNGIEFLVDPTSFDYLEGSEVDFDDGLSGKGFEVRNPNASSTCGCGRSFN